MICQLALFSTDIWIIVQTETFKEALRAINAGTDVNARGAYGGRDLSNDS